MGFKQIHGLVNSSFFKKDTIVKKRNGYFLTTYHQVNTSLESEAIQYESYRNRTTY